MQKKSLKTRQTYFDQCDFWATFLLPCLRCILLQKPCKECWRCALTFLFFLSCLFQEPIKSRAPQLHLEYRFYKQLGNSGKRDCSCRLWVTHKQRCNDVGGYFHTRLWKRHPFTFQIVFALIGCADVKEGNIIITLILMFVLFSSPAWRGIYFPACVRLSRLQWSRLVLQVWIFYWFCFSRNTGCKDITFYRTSA